MTVGVHPGRIHDKHHRFTSAPGDDDGKVPGGRQMNVMAFSSVQARASNAFEES